MKIWQGWNRKRIKSGASQFVLHDMKEEFASEYLFPMLKMGAVYEHKYLLGTSVARPLIAKHLVDVAHEVGADAVAHGATGKGNDQVRFELTVMALDPTTQDHRSLARVEYPLTRRCDCVCRET